MSKITTDDLAELPHVVILQSDEDLRIVEFTGEDGMMEAHQFASDMVLKKGFPGVVMVCCQVRRIANYKKNKDSFFH